MRFGKTLLKMILPILAIAAMATLVVSAEAAATKPPTISGGIFAGKFEGYLTGDRASRAPITLELTQAGSVVSGDITIGKGLVVDGGVCGVAAVPAGEQSAKGMVSARNPRHLDAAADLTVQGLDIQIELDGDLSADGKTLSAVATIDLPWLCGGDPVIEGTLDRTG